ncbi:MAG: hypothetical protein M1315_04590 [Candidatus Thermoplasmatota archaeon]|nr:hypothetical protein [Candidatus Thermoplasmatota archaeon]
MNKRSVAVILVGVLVLSMVFYYISPDYPTGPIQAHPPVTVSPKNVSSFFDPQYVEPSYMDSMNYGLNGSSVYNFTLTSVGRTSITGTVFNASSDKPLSGGNFYAFASPVYTEVPISSSGHYTIDVCVEGHVDLMFKVPGFSRLQENFSLNGGTVHKNIFLNPETPMNLSGYTVSSTGKVVPGVVMNLTGFFFGSSSHESGSNGYFSMSLYEDSYALTVYKKGYITIPAPSRINLTLSEKQNITIYSLENYYNVSGYVKNKAGNPVASAVVSDSNVQGTVLTNRTGFYYMSIPGGPGIINASHQGYITNSSFLFVNSTLNDHNITLLSINPLGNNSFSCNNTGVLDQLKNYTSDVNYGRPGHYILEGNVTVNNTKIPVAFTSMIFAVNSNGTLYGTNVRTNSSGFYKTYFSYPGNYHILVRSADFRSRILNVSLNSYTNYLNFSLVPISNHTITLHVYVRNSLDHAYINNASVSLIYESTGSVVAFNMTAPYGAGVANFSIIAGNYSINASYPDYYPNGTGVLDISKNITITINLTPEQRFSTNLTSISPMKDMPDYGLPDHSPAQIQSCLSGENGTITEPGSYYNLTIFFKENNQPIVNTSFVSYFNILGQVYYYVGSTNSTGYGKVFNLPVGNYEMLPEMFYYNGSIISIQPSSSIEVTAHMRAKADFTDSLDAYNSFNSTLGLPLQVPVKYMNLTDSILPMVMEYYISADGTLYNYTGYYGAFNFTYFNESFLEKNVSIALRGNNETDIALVPYEILIHGNASVEWNYSISHIMRVSNITGLYSRYELAQHGVIYVNFTIDHLDHDFSEKTILNLSDPQGSFYFNVSRSNVSEQSVLEEKNSTTGFWTIGFSGLLSKDTIITGGTVDANLSPVHGMSIDSQTVGFNWSSRGNITSLYLDDYFYFTGTVVNIDLTVGGPSFVPPSPPSINLHVLSVNLKVI